jgi:hypothetical protein
MAVTEPNPNWLAEIVSDDFPVLHAAEDCAFFCSTSLKDFQFVQLCFQRGNLGIQTSNLIHSRE